MGVASFKKPDNEFPWRFLWWVVAFATGIAVSELWVRDYGGAGLQAALALLIAFQAIKRDRPIRWLRVAQWVLVMVIVLLLVMRWLGVLF